jgi:hypothetical protein
MALNITVNKDYRITSDPLNVIVQRRFIVDPTKSPNWSKRQAQGADPTPRIDWREVSYHTTVEKALNWIADQMIRASDAETIAELLGEIKRIRSDFNAIMTR